MLFSKLYVLIKKEVMSYVSSILMDTVKYIERDKLYGSNMGIKKKSPFVLYYELFDFSLIHTK